MVYSKNGIQIIIKLLILLQFYETSFAQNSEIRKVIESNKKE